MLVSMLVVVFSKSKVHIPSSWTLGKHTIPQASSYCYLGIDFASDGGWDIHEGNQPKYEFSRSAELLEGERSDIFSLDQGVAQGCSLSPTLFSVFINDLEVEG